MADNNTLLEKLDGLVARFEEVSTLITDPAVIADQKRYVKLTKEYKELLDIFTISIYNRTYCPFYLILLFF